MASIGGDLIMEIGFGVRPVPEGDNEIALDPLWSRRSRWKRPGGDAVGPIRELAEGTWEAQLAEARDHVRGRLPGLQAALPGIHRAVEMPQPLREFPGCL